MISKPRIYVHAPDCLSPMHLAIKERVLREVNAAGFDPQEFNVSGLPAGINWTFDNAAAIMDRCQGAVIIALPKYDFGPDMRMPSEYAHFEGALALSMKLPTLIVTELGTPSAGITFLGGGLFINRIPQDDTVTTAGTGKGYFDSPKFKNILESWINDVNARSRLFFGYCSRAQGTADAIIKHLIKTLDIDVIDWALDFGAGATIMDEISTAIRSCRCGLFLFTRDDDLFEGNGQYAAPRDNVIFEAGFCIAAKGPQRTIIICEEGAKMPADLGGSIYLGLKDRVDISSIQEKLRQALARAM